MGPDPVRTKCTAVRKDNVNNVHTSKLENFPCYYSNVQSIRNKFNEFSDSVDNYKPLIIGLTETWLSAEVKNTEIEIPIYEIFRCDRADGIGGGSLLYIHNCFQTVACKELDDIGCDETVWRIIKLTDNDKLLVWGCLQEPIK